MQWRAQEKRARHCKTRPEPTIYGNCDSWDFIVGKKRFAYTRSKLPEASLQTSNSIIIHKLSTIWVGNWVGCLWATCGSAVDRDLISRIVGSNIRDMPKPTCRQADFNRLWHEKIRCERSQTFVGRPSPASKNFWPAVVSKKKGPNPSTGRGLHRPVTRPPPGAPLSGPPAG